MSLAVLLIADDLTGACDAGVQFARCGLPTSVLLTRDAPPAWAQVAAVSTETRNLGEEEASCNVAAVAEWLAADVVFKKIDSVLRGNPGVEIRAALEAFGREAAVATPAFPAMGRVNGSEAAAVLRSDVHVMPQGVAEALDRGVRVVSVSASCDEDLHAIVHAAWGRKVLWAGSGGLAAAVARRVGGERGRRQTTKCDRLSHQTERLSHQTDRLSHGNLMFCIGTEHEVTVRQVAELRRVRPESVVVRVDAVEHCGALVVSGGDTAAAVCRAAGARRIDLCDEVLPGIPWGFLRCGRLDGVPVVTKSGGFGAPDALVRVAELFA